MTCGLIVVKYINAPDADEVKVEVFPKSKSTRLAALERPEPRLIKTSLQPNAAPRLNAGPAYRLQPRIESTS
jgi:hypothetical protein